MSAERAFHYWPELRDAVQPPPLERVGGSFSFDAKAEWSKLVAQVEAGTFRLRAPAPSPRGLCGPMYGRGECLRPVFEADVGYYDPTMAPEDGDFVLVLMDPRKARRIEEYVRANPRLLAIYGAGPMDLVSKRLRRFGSEWALQCRDGISFLHDRARGEQHKILGVLRYAEQGGVPVYGSGPVLVPCIDPNAATENYYTSAGADTISGGSVVTVLTVSFTPDVDSDVEISAIAVSDNVDSDAGNAWRLQKVISGSGTVLANTGSTDSNYHTFAIDYVLAVTAGVPIDINLQFVRIGGTTNVLNTSLSATVIKR